MLKENQIIINYWNNKNKQHYIDKGYQYTKNGDAFEVDVKDLTKGSKAKVIVVCDYCGKEIIKKYQTYIAQHDEILGDCCKDCEQIKIKNTWMKKYGCENVFQSDYAKEKSKQTCREKYNTDFACQSEEVKQKIQSTMIERHGVHSMFCLEEVRNKVLQDRIQKYGSTSVFDIPGVKEKYEKTMMERFGVLHPSQSPEIREKIMESYYKNGTIATSKPQVKLYETLKTIYGNCELNYPCNKYSLDCMLRVNDTWIDAEYDGWIWHKDNQEHDLERDKFIIQQGYKVLRIKANQKFPTEEQLKEAIDYLVKGNHSYNEIILDI